MQVLVQQDNNAAMPTLVELRPVPQDKLPSCFHSDPKEGYMLFNGQNCDLDIRQTWPNNSVTAKHEDPPQYTYVLLLDSGTWYVFPENFAPANFSVIWR